MDLPFYRFDGQRDFGRIFRGDQAAGVVQHDRCAAEYGGKGAGRARGRVAAVHGRWPSAERPRPVGRALRGDGPVQPVRGRSSDPVAVSLGRGVSVRPDRRPLRDQQRGQKIRGRQLAAVRGAQVLPAGAGAADQQALRPQRQPREVQQHLVHVDVLTVRAPTPVFVLKRTCIYVYRTRSRCP